jgi:hypothetical protein
MEKPSTSPWMDLQITQLQILGVLFFIAIFLARPLMAERPVLRVLTTFDPTILKVAERVHEFEARNHCWVDWVYLHRSEVEVQLFGHSMDYDVVSVDEPWVAGLSDRLLPLADWPAREGTERERHPLASWEGHCYGLMQLENYYLYVYRADVFGDTLLSEDFERRNDKPFWPPENIESLLEVARYFKEATDYEGLALVQDPPESVVFDLVWCLKAAGVEMSAESMSRDPDLAKIRWALQQFRNLHRLAPAVRKQRSLEGINQVYSRGEVAHVLQWLGFSEELRSPLFSRVGTKTAFAPLPGSDAREPFCMTGHWFLCIPAESVERVELAAAFIDWYHEIVQQQNGPIKDLRRELQEVVKISRPRSRDYLELSKRLYAIAQMVLKSDASIDECAQLLVRDLSEFDFITSRMLP